MKKLLEYNAVRVTKQRFAVNHDNDIMNIDRFGEQYGIRVNGYTDGPRLTTYRCQLRLDSNYKKIESDIGRLQIALKDDHVRVYRKADQLCIEKKTNDSCYPFGDGYAGLMKYAADRPDSLPLLMGADTTGSPIVGDLDKMVHLLVAGASGSGKSKLLHSIICSLVAIREDDIQLKLIDPKDGAEFFSYLELENVELADSAVTACQMLRDLVELMDRRYMTLRNARCRDAKTYRAKGGDMPQVVVVIDELADLVMVTKEAEGFITRLSQKARAAGIHLVLATQKPSADVITTLIRANITSRVALKTKTRQESRIILDANGAETLTGNGDMLFWPADREEPIRGLGCLLSDTEIDNIVYMTSHGLG